MRRLREKLHSESGASILIALLLFLVCCMVAASILAAAMSNAGKSRSNRAEQQKYLTLSSAIRFVADEIEKVEYTWKYTVYEWDVTTDSDTEDSDTEYFFYCRQIEGEYVDTDGDGSGDLLDQIPLKKWLDWELEKQFLEKAGGSGSPQNGYEPLIIDPDVSFSDFFSPGVDDNTGSKTTRSLLVTLPDDLDGYPYENPDDPMKVYQIPDVVTVRVELDHTTHHIKLTAWLGTGAEPADKSDTMIAELVASGEAPLLGYNNPEGRTGSGSAPDDSSLPVWENKKTMKWKLNWIKKGGL